MIDGLLRLIGLGGPEAEGRQLARDARAVIEMIHGQHAAESLRKIAATAKRHIAEVHERGLDEPKFYKRGVEHLTDLNRAARNRRDNISWSGITLAVIYVKAEMIGDFGKPALNAIEGYFDEWAHADGDADVSSTSDGMPSGRIGGSSEA